MKGMFTPHTPPTKKKLVLQQLQPPEAKEHSLSLKPRVGVTKPNDFSSSGAFSELQKLGCGGGKWCEQALALLIKVEK